MYIIICGLTDLLIILWILARMLIEPRHFIHTMLHDSCATTHETHLRILG